MIMSGVFKRFSSEGLIAAVDKTKINQCGETFLGHNKCGHQRAKEKGDWTWTGRRCQHILERCWMLAGQSPERKNGSRFLGAPLMSHVGCPDEPQAYVLLAVQNINDLSFLIRNIRFFVLICSVLSTVCYKGFIISAQTPSFRRTQRQNVKECHNCKQLNYSHWFMQSITYTWVVVVVVVVDLLCGTIQLNRNLTGTVKIHMVSWCRRVQEVCTAHSKFVLPFHNLDHQMRVWLSVLVLTHTQDFLYLLQRNRNNTGRNNAFMCVLRRGFDFS